MLLLQAALIDADTSYSTSEEEEVEEEHGAGRKLSAGPLAAVLAEATADVASTIASTIAYSEASAGGTSFSSQHSAHSTVAGQARLVQALQQQEPAEGLSAHGSRPPHPHAAPRSDGTPTHSNLTGEQHFLVPTTHMCARCTMWL
jgi:hypothetical protein